MKGLQPENRPATAQERSLIEWLLRHGKPGSEQFLKQVGSLVVVSKCTCGCPTVHFAQEGEAVVQDTDRILADYLARVNKEDVGIILFQKEGRLSLLEVYSLAGTEEAFGLPELESIYSWEELPNHKTKRNDADG